MKNNQTTPVSRPSLSRRRFLQSGSAGVLGGVAGATTMMATAATAAEPIQLKMATSWPKASPGPGQTADRLAQRIEVLSGGRIKVKLFAAGELVSPLEVFDAVQSGAADLGHSAAFFWQGKMPAAAFFTAVPFGLTAIEHTAWIHHGGGQVLWDELYGANGVKPFMAGNTGTGMGGWFKKPIESLDDLQGLKYRIPGLGGEILKRLGAVPVSVAPGEILTALQNGVVDGAEFLGPWSDLAFGFYKVAPHYYWPGFHEPNGSAECLINAQLWSQLDDDLKVVVESACAVENSFALSETEWRNAESLPHLIEHHNVDVRPFPDDILAAARTEADEVLTKFAEGSEVEQHIVESYLSARSRAIEWSRVSRSAFLAARNG